jgi:hypothetical protein
MRRNMTHISVPVVGEVHLPAPEELAFIGGTAVLALVGILEWPVAVLLSMGHVLAMNRRNKVVHALGEALEEA